MEYVVSGIQHVNIQHTDVEVQKKGEGEKEAEEKRERKEGREEEEEEMEKPKKGWRIMYYVGYKSRFPCLPLHG